MRRLQDHCHLGLGTLYAKIGQRDQARAELSAAIDLYRSMDMTCSAMLCTCWTYSLPTRWKIGPGLPSQRQTSGPPS
jgi:hypothetical protein